MIFSNCLKNIPEKDKSLVDACLQVLFSETDLSVGILDDLSIGESTGTEYAFIYIDDDWENEIPEFIGICFEYLEKYTVINKDIACDVITRVINQNKIQYNWLGFGSKK